MGSSNPKTRETFWRSKRIRIEDSTQTDGASIQVSKKMGCCWSSQLFLGVLIFDLSPQCFCDSASCKKTSKVGSGLSFSARLIWLIWVALSWFCQTNAKILPNKCHLTVRVTSGRFSSLLASGGALPTDLQLAPGYGRRQQFSLLGCGW